MMNKELNKPEDSKPELTDVPPEADGNQQQEDDKGLGLLAEANKAAERLETANKVRKELLDREEKILAEAKLAGRSYGSGNQPKPLDPLKDPVNYANAVRNGKINPLG
jgi:hypothetical protein